MASTAENIIRDLFETPGLNDVSAEQLKQITEEHPYFGAAHFLFAKKLFLSKQAGYHQALQKAAIHFPNELWLHYNLNEDGENIAADDIADEAGGVTTTEGAGNNNEAENVIASEPDEIAIEDEENQVEDYTEDDALNVKLSSILQEQAAEFEKPVESSTEIPVETVPYHRVDYFDSQGIKLEEGNDKLGTQLKRFTDWLKQMKRISPNPVNLGNDEAGENQVQGIAAHSNEAEEIVTEAMAEVLLKQGKPEQAIHIYEKLSFNNPSKSAYFAAKIEELKG